jgi:hypothetical protein
VKHVYMKYVYMKYVYMKQAHSYVLSANNGDQDRLDWPCNNTCVCCRLQTLLT